MKKELAVKKSVTVNAPQKHVFTVFTEGHGAWWPLETHHIGAQTPQTVIIEPRAGGRWFERAADGTECDWGRVLLWEPFGRLILTWEISAQFTRHPNLKTEVEVRFIAEGSERTRVELEHRLLENYGEQAGMMQSIFDSDGGWTGILTRFAAQAAGAALSTEVVCSADQLADQPK
jgi:uncharacterized protein YndB with AHSA1/START domain